MKRIFALLAIASALCACRKEPVIVPGNEGFDFFACNEDFYGDYYGNGCDNYVLTLSGCPDSPGLFLVLDLNGRYNPNGLGVSAGMYRVCRGSDAEYTFVEGAINGSGQLSGSFFEVATGSVSEYTTVKGGHIGISYQGNILIIEGTLNAGSRDYDIYCRCVPVVTDCTADDPVIPDDPDPDMPDVPENVEMTVTSVQAANYGNWYTDKADDWFILLENKNTSKTGERISIDLFAEPGSRTLPLGTFPISEEYVPQTALAGWMDDSGDELDYGGVWYEIGSYIWYGATSGTITISKTNGNYTIKVNCVDDIEGGTFKASYTGGIDYFEPDAAPAATKASGRGRILHATISHRDANAKLIAPVSRIHK